MTETLTKKDLICDNLSVNESGELLFASQNTLELAKQYGTPLYLMDEDKIREKCRTYLNAARAAFGGKAKVLYASKAASYKRLYEIMKEEGMGIDVVSSGEIYTANLAGYDLANAFFHSNNKTDDDIRFAMDSDVGYFVADNAEELYAIEKEADRRGVTQKVLLRITPGIDPHTYEKISTGKVDSKFGSAIETGQACEIIRVALSLKNVELVGYHCHVGSQLFDSEIYKQSAEVMLGFAKAMQNELGYTASIIDLGGGYGVRYVESQPTIDIGAGIEALGVFIREKCKALGMDVPEICFEPGRSIVADAGMTLYTAGTVKKIPGYKNYVSVDGGMTDNIRYALYGAPYTLLPAGKMEEERSMICSIVGRCCESGDVLQENVPMPESISRGDIIACLTTGAYHYSMASNYNRIPRPPVVMLSKGSSYLAVKRETREHLASLDI